MNFLREISTLNNGKLLRISKSEPISENIVDIIKKGEDSLISSFEFSDYEHKFQYPLAIATKSGFTISVEAYLLSKNNCCHCLTIPKKSLFKTTILTATLV